MMRRVPAVCTALAVASCASAPPSLDGVIGFEDVRSCQPSESFRALLDSFVSPDSLARSYSPKLEPRQLHESVRDAAGTLEREVDGRGYRVTLPLRGTWQGLPLQSVAVVGWAESEEGFELSFNAPRAQVRATANRLGLEIPESGSVYREGEVLGVNIGIERRGSRSVLYCFPG